MSSTLRDCIKLDFVGTIISSPRKKYTLEMLSCVLWVSILVRPRGGNLTQNGDPRVWKLTFENLKMSNFRWVAPPPILGQTIDRCIKLILSCVTLTVFLGHHTSLGKMLAITHVSEVQMQKLTWQYLNPLNESALI